MGHDSWMADLEGALARLDDKATGDGEENVKKGEVSGSSGTAAQATDVSGKLSRSARRMAARRRAALTGTGDQDMTAVDVSKDGGTTPTATSRRTLSAKVSRERSPHRGQAGTLDGGTAETATSSSLVHPAGTRVVLCSLQSRPELRGMQATVLDFDPESGRYRIELRDGKEKLRVKADNLNVSIFG